MARCSRLTSLFMLDLNDLYYFVQVVDRKGFTAASSASGVPKSNLSRRILKLEKHLGVELIRRSSRRFVVTELGAAFYQHCRAMVIEAEEAEHLVRSRQAEPVGRVRFSCPVALGQHVLADLLPRFMQSHPKVNLVERLTNAAVDLVEDGFDLALRMHANPLETPGLVHRPVCPVQLILVGSPRYLETLGGLADVDALHGAAALAHDADEEPAWQLRHDDGRTAVVPHRRVLCSDDWMTLNKVAMAGLGIAALPPHVCRDQLATGALQRVLPQWHAGQALLSMFTPPRRGTLPAVRAFAEYLLKELPQALSPRP